MKGFTTRAIHAASLKKDVHGALRPPVYDSAAFEFDSARDLELVFAGKKPAHAYSRITNPTVDDYENRVRLLSGAFGVIAVSSGMAAIASTVMALADSGSNVVTTKFLFGHTILLFERTLGRWGLSVKYADMTDPDSVAGAIDENTRMVFLESITNPQLEVADVSKVCEVASTRSVPVVLDGTLTTPYLFPSREHGVAVEILSSTKYISGGATCVGGLIIDNGKFDWNRSPVLRNDVARFGPGTFLARLRHDVCRHFGCCLAPHHAYLKTIGLETMALRVEKSCVNSLAIARFLEGRPDVRRVHYPGLPSSTSHAVAHRQFNGRFGALLTFDLESKEKCFRFMDGLKIVRRATNLNDNKTLIIHPASTIFADYSVQEKASMKVGDEMIRLAVGIEDVDDIIGDITQALEALR